jgi:hypothetical protein
VTSKNPGLDDRNDTSKTATPATPGVQTAGGNATQRDAGGGQYARDDGVQGEGNYEAARKYDEAQRKFVESGRVDEAAKAAAPRSPQEEREMQDAEREGKSHRKSDER